MRGEGAERPAARAAAERSTGKESGDESETRSRSRPHSLSVALTLAARPSALHLFAMPWESAPPFALIMVMLGGMGGIQAGVHKLFHGKPKAVGSDAWDRATVARDERVTSAAGVPAKAPAKVRG